MSLVPPLPLTMLLRTTTRDPPSAKIPVPWVPAGQSLLRLIVTFSSTAVEPLTAPPSM